MSVRFRTENDFFAASNSGSAKNNSSSSRGYEPPSLAAAAAAASGRSQHEDNAASAAPLELSLSRFSLPTLSSSRQYKKTGENETAAPPEVQELARLTPRERIKREFQMRHCAMSHQRPTALFGSNHDKEQARREQLKSQSGYVSAQAESRKKIDEEKQALRLARSQMALSMSMAVEMGKEEKVEKKGHPSSWALNSDGANRHKFQVNWPLRGAGELPSMPDKWSGPGPGAYGGSTSFLKTSTVKGL